MSLCSQSIYPLTSCYQRCVVYRTAAWAPPGSLLDMPSLRPYARAVESESAFYPDPQVSGTHRTAWETRRSAAGVGRKVSHSRLGPLFLSLFFILQTPSRLGVSPGVCSRMGTTEVMGWDKPSFPCHLWTRSKNLWAVRSKHLYLKTQRQF